MEMCLEPLFNKAKKLIYSGEIEEAKKILETLLFLDSRDRYINLEYARILLRNDPTNKTAKNILLFLYCEYNDFNAMIELGILELQNGNFKKARQYFESVLNVEENAIALQKLIYMEIHNKNYEEAYELYKRLMLVDYSKCFDIDYISILLHNQLGITMDDDDLINSYLYQQLIDYSEQRAIEHIKYHYDENEYKRIHSVYSNLVNVDVLFRDSKEKIQNINPKFFNTSDHYELEYNYILGISNDKITNMIKIITIPNTKKILSIYPIENHNLKLKVKQECNFLR